VTGLFDDDPGEAGHDSGPRRPWSVSGLTSALRATVEGRFPAVTVEGEVSNCRPWSTGHIYFTLKDDYAQLRAVAFRKTAQALRVRPADGQHVVARGRLTVYDVKGEYQLVVDQLQPVGLGALQAAFEDLKRRLRAEGLFDEARKRPLPVLPRRIGVVTSADGAALRDILRVLGARHPAARVLVRPSRVQGDGAAADLVRALQAIARVPELDVVIIGRGGGSIEDLWAFNDEALARAIAACPVPVISAVGHEVDFTIADFVADVRAATPSNAAELVVDRADAFDARIGRATDRLRSAIRGAVRDRADRLERAGWRLSQWPDKVALRTRDAGELALRASHAARRVVVAAGRRLETLRRRLEARDVGRLAAQIRSRLHTADTRLRELAGSRRLSAEARARVLAGRLQALSPLAVLARGYAVCWDEARASIIRSAGAVAEGDRIRVTLASGELACAVVDRRPAGDA
jgi:exodeoxyribonuclease VII large subunit